MPREAHVHQRIGVLRAIATCIATEPERPHDEPPEVRVYEEAPPRANGTMAIRFEVPRRAFWAAVGQLRSRRLVKGGRVYQEHRAPRGPGEDEWARSLSVVYALAEYVERGYPLAVDHGPHGMPTDSTAADATRTLQLTVNMHAYDSIAAHWPVGLAPEQVAAPRAG